MALGALAGVGPDDEVETTGGAFTVRASEALLGRVVDGLGRPLDGGPADRPGVLVAGRSRPAERARSAPDRAPDRDRDSRPRRSPDARRRAADRARRGIGRREEHAARRDRARGRRGRRRGRAGRRARARSGRVPRARAGPHRPREERRRRRHERRIRARAAPRRPGRDRVRRVLPRPGQARHAPRRLRHALRACPARGGPRRRRAPGAPRVPAERLRDAPAPPRALGAGGERGIDHRHHTVLGRKGATWTSRSPTKRAASSTGTSSSIASSPRAGATPRSTSRSPSRASWTRSSSREHRDAARRLRAMVATYEAKRDLVALGAYAKGTDKELDEAIVRMPRRSISSSSRTRMRSWRFEETRSPGWRRSFADQAHMCHARAATTRPRA